MIDPGGALGLPVEPRPVDPGRRSISFVVRGSDTDSTRGIRFEADTDSGTAYSIGWSIGFGEGTACQKYFKPQCETPWSTTIPETAYRQGGLIADFFDGGCQARSVG
ncbi:hypothetical protein ACIBSW_36680 [Actinoplanes sp. NPDC049668]|uniref:hypothetical protein n=1 Tax=unclassified Actinoplanes TaxID=2626549 RepID=UPI0033BD1328